MATSLRPAVASSAGAAGSTSRPGTPGWSARRAIWGLVVLGILVRAWVVLAGWFAGDDFVLQGLAWGTPFTTDYLLEVPTGSFMPGALAVQWPLAQTWPMERAPLAVVLIASYAVAVVAFALLALELWGPRRLTVVPVAVVAVSPLTLPAGVDWATALSALPLQVALTFILWAVVRWARTGRSAWLVAGVVAWLPSLAFTEAAALVPLVALAFVPVLHPDSRVGASLTSALRRGWMGWSLALAGIVAYVVIVVRFGVAPGRSLPGIDQVADVLARGVSAALAPAVVGGPFEWTRIGGASALASPPGWLMVAAAEVLVVLVVWSSTRGRAARRAWMWAGGAIGLTLLGATLGPLSAVDPVFVQSMKLIAVSAVPVAVAVGFGLVAVAPSALALTRRAGSANPLEALRGAAAVVAGVLVVLSVISTARYREVVRSDSSRGFVMTAAESLAGAADGPSLVDDAVPGWLVSPLRFPYNQASWTLGPLQPRPDFGDPTTRLRVFDRRGELQPALVVGVNAQVGPVTGCGWIVRGAADIWLKASVVDYSHLVRIGYLSTGDGTASVAIGDGTSRDFPVTRGLGEIVIRLAGGGNILRVTGLTPGVTMCTDDVSVGAARVVES